MRMQSNFPFPAEPWRTAVHDGKRTSHHLIVYYAVPIHGGGRLALSAGECDAAVWVVGDQRPYNRTPLQSLGFGCMMLVCLHATSIVLTQHNLGIFWRGGCSL